LFNWFKPKPTYSEYVVALHSSGFIPLSEREFASWSVAKQRRAIRDYTQAPRLSDKG
jgi:hypothetical protein